MATSYTAAMDAPSPRILPKAPLRLHWAVVGSRVMRALVLSGFGVLILGGGWWWQSGTIGEAWSHGTIWSTGKQAVACSVKGKHINRRWFSNSYKLDVSYQDSDEEWHSGHLEFDTLGASANTDKEPDVKYDPKDPSRFALNWAEDAKGARWGSILLFVSMVTLIGGGMLVAARRKLRELADLRACARAFDEVEIEIIGIEAITDSRGRSSGVSRCSYRIPDSGRTGETEVPANINPLTVDNKGARVLALRPKSLPDQMVVVDESFKPFSFNEGEQYVIKKRLAERRKQPVKRT